MLSGAWSMLSSYMFSKGDTAVLAIEGTLSSSQNPSEQDARVNILKTQWAHAYQLVVQILTETEDRVFLLSRELNWQKLDGCFAWEQAGVQYQFHWKESSTPMVDAFHLSIARCVWEHTRKQAADSVSSEELSKFMLSIATPAKQTPNPNRQFVETGTPYKPAATPSKAPQSYASPAQPPIAQPTHTPKAQEQSSPRLQLQQSPRLQLQPSPLVQASQPLQPPPVMSPQTFAQTSPRAQPQPQLLQVQPSPSMQPQPSQQTQSPAHGQPQPSSILSPQPVAVPQLSQPLPSPAPTDSPQHGTQDNDIQVAGERLIACGADLWIYDKSAHAFREVEIGVVIAINNISDDEYEFFLYVLKDEKVLVEETVSSKLQANWLYSEAHTSITWTTEAPEGPRLLSCRFHNSDEMDEFKRIYIKALWESLKQSPFPKDEKDQDWIYRSFALKKDVLSEDSEEASVEEDEQFTDDEDDTAATSLFERDESKNSLLAVGRKSDRSFVVRGTKLGVFKHDREGLKYQTAIENIMSPSRGGSFQPKTVMLHEEDTSLLLLNPEEKHKVYRMDLERGKVVDEWDTEGLHTGSLLPEQRFAQRTPLKTFGVLNNGGLFIVDPRQKGSQVVKSRTFQYKDVKNTAFSCASTTKDGGVAVGTKFGEIRLFNRNALKARANQNYLDYAPRAATRFPGLGDPIIGIDVTTDGEWVLATCKTYLVLLATKSEEKDGFAPKGLGADKPSAIQLWLKPEDMATVGNVSFTPAKFNQEEGKERTIVTSTGPYVITWSLQKARQRKVDCYHMKKYDDVVVANDFECNTDKRVVVTMPDDVKLATRHAKQH